MLGPGRMAKTKIVKAPVTWADIVNSKVKRSSHFRNMGDNQHHSHFKQLNKN